MPLTDHISICICTYRRNVLLEKLLRGVALQNTAGKFTYSIVVIDNDSSGPARATVTQVATELRLDVTYSIEKEPTIPAARNHALALARGNFVAIIDDDEFPSTDWLLKMYEATTTFGVDGALGPIYPFFTTPPPAWLIKSGLCELPSWRTGTLLHWSQTRTGNVLITRSALDLHGLQFDLRFRTGGSDQDFFRRAMAKDCRFVYVEEAPVYEVVPPVRWTRKYWIKRALVNGFNAKKYAEKGTKRWSQFALAMKSVVAVPLYAAATPVCACLGQHLLMKCLEKGCYHFSRTSATLGLEVWKKRDF